MKERKINEVVNFLEEWCEFGDDRVYVLMAMTRAKENGPLSSNNEVVFREVIKNEYDIERKVRKLNAAGESYSGDHDVDLKFRMYVSVAARNTMKAFFNFLGRANGWQKDLYNGDDHALGKFKRLDTKWYSELQRPSSKDETYFIFDLDDVTGDELNVFLNDLSHEGVDVEVLRETPNGYHVVTDPFNYTDFSSSVDYEIHKDRMLFLSYI